MGNKKIFVDSNIFLQYLTNNKTALTDKIELIFQKALTGKIKLITNEIVIAEIICILESFYKREKNEIEIIVSTILNTRGLEVKSAHLLFKALNIYASKDIDFIDAFNAVYMEDNQMDSILTMDNEHFSRIDNLCIEKF